LIEKLTIQGFQAHDELILTLDRGVTTIIGPSDAGKSSIIRALRWLALNQPAGDSFIRWGAKRARVELKVDGKFILRERGSENLYSLDVREFKAFANGVPGEISSILGMDEINFQGQYDGPFWLSNTAGEVSRHLNRIVGLEVIDEVLSKLTSLIRKRGTEVEVVEERLKSAKEDCREWKFAEQLNDELSRLEGMSDLLDEMADQTSRLEESIQSYEAGVGDREHLKPMIAVGLIVIEAWEISRNYSERVSGVEALVGSAEAQESLICRASNLPNLLCDITKLEQSIKSVDELAGFIKSADQCAVEEAGARGAAEQLLKRWDRDIGEECPLCGQQIKL